MKSRFLHLFLFLCLAWFCDHRLKAQFTDVTTAQIPQAGGDAQFGDLDADGDLDLVVLGFDNEEAICRISFNNGFGNFVPAFNLNLEGLSSEPSLALADFNQDGLVDFVTSGRSNELDANGNRILKTILYRNVGGEFEIANDQLTGFAVCDLEWGDSDNDGDLDLLGNGFSSFDPDIYSTILYENAGNNVFLEKEVAMGISSGNAEFGDYDGDGDLDIAVFGNAEVGAVGELYENVGNNEFIFFFELINVFDAAIEWGDFDSDGDVDLAGTGFSPDFDTDVTFIYENTFSIDGEFVFHDLGLNIFAGDIDAADFNNDGLLDLGITGVSSTNGFDPQAVVLQNEGGFNFSVFEFLPNHRFSFDWGDIDGDGLQDIVLTGVENNEFFATRILRNDGGYGVNSPSIPNNLNSIVDQNSVNLSWENPDPATHTYNVNLYGDVGQVILPPVNFFNNSVQIPGKGYTQNLFVEIDKLAEGTYFWSVQANSGSDVLSDFTAEESFEITNPLQMNPSPYQQAVFQIEDDNIPFKQNLVIADLNNDRLHDILVTNEIINNVLGTQDERLFLFQDGEYIESTSYTGTSFGSISSVADINEDNLLDIINRSGPYYNLEFGSFDFQELTTSQAFIPYDFDNDGDQDLLYEGESRYLQANAREFLDIKRFTEYTISQNTRFFPSRVFSQVVDFDGNGLNDLIELPAVERSLQILSPEEGFERYLISEVTDTLSNQSIQASIADFWQLVDVDNDEDYDLITLVGYAFVDQSTDIQTRGAVGINYYKNENSNFVFQGYYDATPPGFGELSEPGNRENFANSRIHSFEVGDVNNDGYSDILIGFQSESGFDFPDDFSTNKSCVLFRNQEGDEFELIETFNASIGRFIDIDEDYDLDLITVNNDALFINNTNPTTIDFSPPVNLRSSISGDTLIFEWDHDQLFDSFNLEIEYAPFDDPENRSIITHSGSFEDGLRKQFKSGNSSGSKIHKLVNVREGIYYWKVQAIDKSLNGTAFSEEDTLEYEPFNYNAFFQSQEVTDLGTLFYQDGDSDGDIDIFATKDGESIWFENDEGNLEEGTNPGIEIDGNANIPFIIEFIDINADGRLDIIYQTDSLDSVALWTAPFTYQTSENYALPLDPEDFVDIDNDGDLDMLYRDDPFSFSDFNLVLSINNGIGWESPDTLDIQGSVQLTADLDNNGWKDLVIDPADDFEQLLTIYNYETGLDIENPRMVTVRTEFGIGFLEAINLNDDEYIDVIDVFSTLLLINSEGVLSEPFTFSLATEASPNINNIIDLDADGDSDLFDSQGIIGRNDSLKFIERAFLREVDDGAIVQKVLDIDKDGLPNYILTGESGEFEGQFFESFLVNVSQTSGKANTSPQAPSNLNATANANTIELSWNPAIDNETPSQGLFYNVYIRSATDTLVYPYTNANGDKQLINFGNAAHVEKFVHTNLDDGTYFWAVQAIDNSFATSSFSEEQSFEIFVGPELELADSLACQEDVVTYTVQPDGFAYQWKFKGGERVDSTENSLTIRWLDTLTTQLMVTNVEFDRSDTISVTIEDKPAGNFSFGENLGTDALVQFSDSSSATVSEWQWDFGDGNSSSDQNPVNVFLSSGAFDVQLTVFNSNGCSDALLREVFVQDIIPIRVADVVTPNGDGKNDFLFIENIERYPDNSLVILNSLGQEVFSTTGYNNNWFGDFQGNTLPAGQYVCILKLEVGDTERRESFSIIR
ncbi:MAG: FG-GAP-like repeat-containing protein [Bacteroidota bacterium]